MACALQCSAGLAMCSACNSFAGCPARLARCFARMCTAAATSRQCERFSMLLQLAVGSSAAGCLPSRWSLARGSRRIDASVGEPLRTYGRLRKRILLRHGFFQHAGRGRLASPKPSKLLPRVADGAIVNCGDIKLVLGAAPPPRRLSHQQVARGSPQDVLRAARAGKGLRRMLRTEYRRDARQVGVLGRVVELEDEHRLSRFSSHFAASTGVSTAWLRPHCQHSPF